MQKKRINAKQREQEKRERNKAKAEKFAQKKVDETSQGTNVAVNVDNVVAHAAEKKPSKQGKRTINKTKAKAMGLKSTLVFDDKLVVTSFADSKVSDADYKSANIEKVTDFSGHESKEYAELAQPHMFRADVTPSDILLKNSKEQTITLNPAHGDIGADYIGLKSAMEKNIFGSEYKNDSLHIQIAYNIFDIKKILGTYINNIIYIFYNLNRGKISANEQSRDDIVGMLYTFADMNKQNDTEIFEKAKKFLKTSELYYVYFGDIFKKIKKDDGKAVIDDKLSKNFDVLRMLSYARNLCMHGVQGKTNFDMSDSALFNIGSCLSNQPKLLTLLDETYSRYVTKLNNDFRTNSKNNLYILRNVYAESEITTDELVRIYYELSVVKDNKNLGINLVKLREGIVTDNFKEVFDKSFDTYRGKLYTVLNFILYNTICNNDALRRKMVEDLRANQNGEDGKEAIYKKYSKEFAKIVGVNFTRAIEAFKEEAGNKFANKIAVPNVQNCSYAISADDTDYFVKLLYFIAKFLDGKEINELFCSMINKFDNIADLIETAAVCGSKIRFASGSGYTLFYNSKNIGMQLRVAKNLAAMGFSAKKKAERDKGKSNESKENELTYSEALYLDALSLLGYDIKKYELSDGKVCVDENNKPVFTREYMEFRHDFFETPLIKNGSYVYKNGKKQLDHKIRNFIMNNILKSKWFFYVVKYNSPAKCRKFMRNKDLLAFVLKDIPEAQINRYYKTVTGIDDEGIDVERMRNVLIERLFNFSVGAILSDVQDFSEEENKDQREGSSKEKLKALVRLYLTVAYLITKSMVKVNTRFSIAFSTLERDYYLDKGQNLQYSKNDNGIYSQSHALDLTKQFIEEDEKIVEAWKAEGSIIAATISKDEAHKAERKAAMRANDRKLKDMHFSTRYFKFIKEHLNTVNQNGWDNPEYNMFSLMRNNVMHLSVVNRMDEFIGGAKCKTYYGLYCYVLQRILFDKTSDAKKRQYINAVQVSGGYCKDLMWYLNLPFAYNLARYKNLSMEALFYDEYENTNADDEN